MDLKEFWHLLSRRGFRIGDISDVTTIRTDTTLDYIPKADLVLSRRGNFKLQHTLIW